jgi:hypothetical protein
MYTGALLIIPVTGLPKTFICQKLKLIPEYNPIK